MTARDRGIRKREIGRTRLEGRHKIPNFVPKSKSARDGGRRGLPSVRQRGSGGCAGGGWRLTVMMLWLYCTPRSQEPRRTLCSQNLEPTQASEAKSMVLGNRRCVSPRVAFAGARKSRYQCTAMPWMYLAASGSASTCEGQRLLGEGATEPGPCTEGSGNSTRDLRNGQWDDPR